MINGKISKNLQTGHGLHKEIYHLVGCDNQDEDGKFVVLSRAFIPERIPKEFTDGPFHWGFCASEKLAQMTSPQNIPPFGQGIFEADAIEQRGQRDNIHIKGVPVPSSTWPPPNDVAFPYRGWRNINVFHQLTNRSGGIRINKTTVEDGTKSRLDERKKKRITEKLCKLMVSVFRTFLLGLRSLSIAMSEFSIEEKLILHDTNDKNKCIKICMKFNYNFQTL